ncbi:hypothetical protein [Halorarum halobium]|uniref:hypothetical protein n=1 Tax=Halorarum halobium TaxID=3075121 RepID=UPI0028AE6FCB|nr:hypothetical protein [Halobaculum sp. XH14]
MSSAVETVVYLLLTVVLMVVVGFLVLLGPVGWLLAAFLLGSCYFVARMSGVFDEGEPRAPTKVNCPDCGARNEADREACHHCGEPLEAA